MKNARKQEILDAVLRLRTGGMSQPGIARLLGRPISTVNFWCQRYGREYEENLKAERNKKHFETTRLVLREFSENLLSLSAIATHHHLPSSTVSKIVLTNLSAEERCCVIESRKQRDIARKKKILEQWLVLKSMNAVAKKYGVSKGTLSGWKNQPWVPPELKANIAAHLESMKGKAKPVPKPKVRETNGPPPAESQGLHALMQYRLAVIGIAMGFTVWIPKNDRNAVRKLASADLRLLDEWPCGYLSSTIRDIVDKIDVLYFHNAMIVRCFEVENSTPISAGLGRIHDLIKAHPNFVVRGHIVSHKTGKFFKESGRELFRQMSDRVTLLPYQAIDSVYNNPDLKHMKDSYLDSLAIRFDRGKAPDPGYGLPSVSAVFV